jgi:hypothetical protein
LPTGVFYDGIGEAEKQRVARSENDYFGMFLVTGEYRIQRDGDVYPYGIFRQISVYQFVMTFSSREEFPLRNQVPDFRRKKLIPVIAYTYYIECLHGLIHLFPVSVVPHHQK